MVKFTYRTWLLVTSFIVQSVSSTRLPPVLRCRVQTLSLATWKASSTRLWARWPFSPGCPTASNYTQTYHLPVRQLNSRVQFACAFALVYSLGHSVLLQDCASLELPKHPLPPLCGGGLLHRRTRVMSPSPHVVVHADQGDQRPQFPSARTRHETCT